MASNKTFSAKGDGPELLAKTPHLAGQVVVEPGDILDYAVSGTFVGTVLLQQFLKGGWTTLATITSPVSGTVIAEDPGNASGRARFRFHCEAYTSGSIVTALSVDATVSQGGLTNDSGSAGVAVTGGGTVAVTGTLTATNAALTTPAGAVAAVEASFAETTGAGVYTAAIAVPAGATILDIIVNGVALWNAGTSATLIVGDAGDDDGFYTGVDLEATDLLAGESLSFSDAGGKAGAYIANSQVSPRYSATARVVSGIVTAVGTGGTTGRTRMTVVYHLPVTADIVAAAKV
jgi:hypothetical protein